MQPEQRMSKKRRRELRAQFITALVLAAGFVLTAVPALLITNLERRLFDVRTYQTALDTAGFYNRLPTLAAQQLHFAATFDTCRENPMACRFPNALPQTRACLDVALGSELIEAVIRNERRPTPVQIRAAQACFNQFGVPAQMPTPPAPGPLLFAFFTPQQIEVILETIIPPQELRAFADQALNETLNYVGGESTSLTLSLGWLKSGLEHRGAEAILDALRTQPACTAEQVTRLALDLALNQSPRDLFLCAPPEDVLLLIQPLVSRGVSIQARFIPETVTLGELPTLSGINLTRSIPLTRAIMRYSGLLPLIFLAALSGVIVRGWKSWLVWWGTPLMLIGILTLGLSTFSLPLLAGAIQQQIVERMPPIILPEIAATMQTLLVDIIGSVLAPITIQSIALSALGLIMVLAARFIKR
ncbi:MAG: hypothetical protein WHV44_13575 [Anaerolineales bacterium]